MYKYTLACVNVHKAKFSVPLKFDSYSNIRWRIMQMSLAVPMDTAGTTVSAGSDKDAYSELACHA